MARPSRSAQQLREASRHVAYEVEMFRQVAEALDGSPQTGVVHNALLEAFLLHTRNLLHFLFAGSGTARPDDVVAVDFTRGASLSAHLTEYDQLCSRISKHLAHITYARASKETWDCQQLVDLLRDGLAEFRRCAVADLLDPCWRTADPAAVQLTLRTLGVTNSLGVIPSVGVRPL